MIAPVSEHDAAGAVSRPEAVRTSPSHRRLSDISFLAEKRTASVQNLMLVRFFELRSSPGMRAGRRMRPLEPDAKHERLKPKPTK